MNVRGSVDQRERELNQCLGAKKIKPNEVVSTKQKDEKEPHNQ